ncbi:MAG TPA: hypothetical protein PKA63_07890 [Oligoflexia bacterium]|nr:hypothetical protein [Oligoflexia bacterium]HMP48571.1 hypothetical protein [Oligoflexia bacterium]
MSNSQNFGLISDIHVDDPLTWKDKIFLTFDIDWAHDDIILDTASILEEHKINATWFVTHNTKVLDKLRNIKNFELGIHPNFNDLLDGIENQSNCEDIIKKLKDLVLESTSVRSHSLTQSERLLDLFAKYNLRNVCNTFIPSSIDTIITPWKMWSDIQIIPHCWQDNVSFKIRLEDKPKIDGSIVVYNFHPIHIFLNSEDSERYESTRENHQNPDELKKYINMSCGVRNFLSEIIGIQNISHPFTCEEFKVSQDL